MAVNPVTNAIYVANYNSNKVTVIDEQQVENVPLNANSWSNGVDCAVDCAEASGLTTCTLNFSATSLFLPDKTVPDDVFFQMDTWQGAWTAMTPEGSPGVFTGQTPPLQPGVHILYAYATDGQEATSTNTGSQSSPLIGNIVAFLLPAPHQILSVPQISPGSLFLQVQTIGDNATGTVTLDNNGTGTFSNFSVAITGAAFSISSTTCSTPGNLLSGESCQIDVEFQPTALGPASGTLTVTNGAKGATLEIPLTGVCSGVTFTPNPLAFTEAVMSTSAPQQVTLTNTLDFAIGITSIAVSGNAFAQTNTCGTSVPAMGTCTISVTFSPMTLQSYSGSITVLDTQGGAAFGDTFVLTGFGEVQAGWEGPGGELFVPIMGFGTTTAGFVNNLPTALNNISITISGSY